MEIIKKKHNIIIADNLVNCKIEVLDKLETITGVKPTFYQIDVRNEKILEEMFDNLEIDGVIHFAGLEVVGESVSKPLEYYYYDFRYEVEKV